MSSLLARMLLLPSALLALSAGFVAGDVLEPRQTTIAAPISFAPDQNWDGIGRSERVR